MNGCNIICSHVARRESGYEGKWNEMKDDIKWRKWEKMRVSQELYGRGGVKQSAKMECYKNNEEGLNDPLRDSLHYLMNYLFLYF